MERTVLCHAYNPYRPQEIVIVRPKIASDLFRAGKLNLPGGSFQEGESTTACAQRHLVEQTSIKCFVEDCVVAGRLVSATEEIFCVSCRFASQRARTQNDNDTIFTYALSQLVFHPDILPDLRLIVPLCMSGVLNWTITDKSRGEYLVHIGEQRTTW